MQINFAKKKLQINKSFSHSFLYNKLSFYSVYNKLLSTRHIFFTSYIIYCNLRMLKPTVTSTLAYASENHVNNVHNFLIRSTTCTSGKSSLIFVLTHY